MAWNATASSCSGGGAKILAEVVGPECRQRPDSGHCPQLSDERPRYEDQEQGRAHCGWQCEQTVRGPHPISVLRRRAVVLHERPRDEDQEADDAHQGQQQQQHEGSIHHVPNTSYG